MNLILVEDDPTLADGLAHTLSRSGYQLSIAGSARYAEQLLAAEDFDLMILDLGLPDRDGLSLLRSMRQQKLALPVLILTARDGLNDRVEGIRQGADDYLTKPFELIELETRIHALIRRCYGGFDPKITVGPLTLDTETHEIRVHGELLALSSREASLLEFLLLNADKILGKERIAQRLAVSGEALADNAIEVHIHRLRKRLAPYPVTIRTLRGLGYMLEVVDERT
ncbi:MAG: response regulator [Methylococcales bacterium]|nr:response regulator [Methylococcales bacterium]